MANWIQNCQICNDGLCIRIEALKKEGRSERQASEIMQEEAYESYPELKKEFSAERIRKRYQYHMKKKLGEILPPRPQWPMCKKYGVQPVRNLSDFIPGPSEAADDGLCWACYSREEAEKKPKCIECGGDILGDVHKHGMCKICRKKDRKEIARSDANRRLEERQKEFDQTPVDTETEQFWTDLINQFDSIERGNSIPCGKVEAETLEKIKGVQSQLFALVHCLDEVIEQSEVFARIK